MEYVIVTVTFRCPACDKSSVEQFIVETEEFDREQMARNLGGRSFRCQSCSRVLPRGTHGSAHTELATPDRLPLRGLPRFRPN